MEKEVLQENICTLLTPEKQNFVVLGLEAINVTMKNVDPGDPREDLQKASDSINIPATPQTGTSYEAKEMDDNSKFQSDKTSPLTPLETSSRKRHNSAIDSNKENPKLKRYKTGILYLGKSKRTLKAQVLRSTLHPHAPKPSTHATTTKKSPKYAKGINKAAKSSKRGLKFSGDVLEDDKQGLHPFPKNSVNVKDVIEKDVKYDCSLFSERQATASECKSWQVYRQTFKCLKNSRKLGPNFPKISKKRRMKRQKATGLITWWSKICSCDPQMHESFVKMISPTEEQTRAAMNDSESSKCVVILQPMVKWKRMRLNGFTHNFTSQTQLSSDHLPVRNCNPKVALKVKGTKKRQKIRVSTNKEVPYQKKTRGRPPKRSQPPSIDALFEIVLKKFKDLSINEDLRKFQPKVDLDDETERVWTLLMANGGSACDEEAELDPKKKEHWANERRALRIRLDSFHSAMRHFLGDRRFSEWNCSIVDAVGGAYLTQNVSDRLSSSAFMALVARYTTQTSNARINDSEAPTSDQFVSIDNVQQLGLERGGPETSAQSEGGIKTTLCEDAFGRMKNKAEQKKENIDWDNIRRIYSSGRARTEKNMDAVDWEAVRRAPVEEVADTIKQRGMNNVLAEKIKAFLDQLVEDHGSIDLEWLRDVPPQVAKDYLLSKRGLGLKSVECIRLLTLHHVAFPVDTNAGRVAVRLGWVPLQPLPIPIHLLKRYPHVNSIQMYIFPRLSNLDPKTLYELHYELITFGKVFCTKRNPHCSSCPMRGECNHFASAFASTRLALPASKTSNGPVVAVQNSTVRLALPALDRHKTSSSDSRYQSQNCKPIIELPSSPEPEQLPSSPEPEPEPEIEDIEDLFKESVGFHEPDDEIPTLGIKSEALRENIRKYLEKEKISLQVGEMSEAWALLDSPEALPSAKLKHVGRLRTIHEVYELPNWHPLLEGVDRLEPNEPSPYLLAIWEEGVQSGNLGSSFGQMKNDINKSSEQNMCQQIVCSSFDNTEEHDSTTVSGTLLIPCRSSNKGKFPLNGTYFQVNEVFADDESTQRPIDVPRKWIWYLPKRLLYCGASATSIFKDLPAHEVQFAFWRGFVCTRGFNRTTRYTTELGERFHIKKSTRGKRKPTSPTPAKPIPENPNPQN